MKNKILILVLIIVFVFVNYPKVSFEIYEEDTLNCECFGLSIDDSDSRKECIGLVYGCERIDNSKVNQKLNFEDRFCKTTTCSDVKDYLGIGYLEGEDEKGVKGINIVIVIDSSGSMKGSNLNHTISAANRFIDSLSIFDQVAVITFNDDASMLYDFSNDFEAVKGALRKIVAANSTNYLPALNKSKELFDEIKGRNNNDNLLIFFSDGQPFDEKNEILDLSDKIKDKDIFISSVWFGEDISESNILKEMASSNEDGKVAFYTTTNTHALYNSFINIYENLKERDYLFRPVSSIRNNLFKPDEVVPFDLKLYTLNNDLLIPGLKIGEGELGCVSKANVEVIVYDKDKNKKTFPLEFLTNSYVGKIQLDEGRYYVFLNITIEQDSQVSCLIQDLQFLKVIEVVNIIDGDDCVINERDDVELFFRQNLVKDFNLNFMLSTQYYNKRVLFAVDSSQSISQDLIEKEKKALKEIIYFLNQQFLVGVIDFSTDSRLIVPFTNNLRLLNTAIDDIYNGGSTRYYPLFQKLSSLYDYSNADKKYEDYVVIISDGKGWGVDRKTEILRVGDNLMEDGVCFYGVIFSDFIDKNLVGKGVVEEVGKLSKNRGCGNFFYVYDKNISAVFYDIYKDLNGFENDLILDTRINKQILSVDEILHLHSNIKSVHNNLEIPFDNRQKMRSEFPSDFCVPEANVNLNIFDSENNLYLSENISYYQDYGHVISLSGFEQDIYRVKLDAKLVMDDDVLEGSNEFLVKFTDPDNELNEFFLKSVYYVFNFMLILFFLYLVYLEILAVRRNI